MPMVSTMPAMPGRVKVASNAAIDAQDQHHVHQHRDRRDDAGEVVVADQEDGHDDQAEDAGDTGPRAGCPRRAAARRSAR